MSESKEKHYKGLSVKQTGGFVEAPEKQAGSEDDRSGLSASQTYFHT